MLNIKDAKSISNNFNCILSINCQSYNQSHQKIKSLINQLRLPQIILLQEMWQPKISSNIANYHPPVEFLRKNTQGGGVATYIRQDINYQECKEINTIVTISIEKVAVITENSKKCIVIDIYRPPKPNYAESQIELEKILEAATKTGIPFTLIGDLNVDLLMDNYIARKYIDLLQTYNCIQTVIHPTTISAYKNPSSTTVYVVMILFLILTSLKTKLLTVNQYF